MVLACVLSACEKKPAGQTVAVVNNEEITAADLNAELSSMNVSAADATKDVRNRALEALIDRRLLAQQAKSDGIDKSPEYLNQERRASEGLLINLMMSRQANTQQVPTAAEIAAYEASHPGMFAKHEIWTLDTITYPLPKDPGVLAKITAAKTLDDVAQALTSGGIQYQRTTRPFDSAQLPPPLFAQLSNLAPGEPFVAPGPDKAVASVIVDRKPAPFTPDQQQQLAVASIKHDRLNNLLTQRIKDLKAKAKIEYGSGFAALKK